MGRYAKQTDKKKGGMCKRAVRGSSANYLSFIISFSCDDASLSWNLRTCQMYSLTLSPSKNSFIVTEI